MEKGSRYISGLKIQANSLAEIKEIVKEIKKANCPYKYITIDTVTALEEMCKPLAIQLYQKSPMFSDKYADVTEPSQLPNGCGWSFWRASIEMVIELIASVTKNLIICGHVKDTKLDENTSGSVRDLDLSGKLKRILSAKSDAIGFVYRTDDGDLAIQFGTDGEVLTGARPAHLACKDIVVASRNEDGTFTSHWDRIFPSEAK